MVELYISKDLAWHYTKLAMPLNKREALMEAFDKIPIADVAEVKHGEWIDNHNGTFTCSVCGGKASKMDYCGNCGAKMDGEGRMKNYDRIKDMITEEMAMNESSYLSYSMAEAYTK